jgi:hypothetical protein
MNEYEIQTISGPVTVLLSDEDAKARGLKAAKPAAAAPEEPAEAKAKAPANKSRQAANKRAEVVEQAFTKK